VFSIDDFVALNLIIVTGDIRSQYH